MSRSGTYTLCVTGDLVLGDAQRVTLKADSLVALYKELRRTIRLSDQQQQQHPDDKTKKPPPPLTIQTVSVFDEEFGEYILLESLANLPQKSKVRIHCTTVKDGGAGMEVVDSAKDAATGAFYSHVARNILLPAIAEMSGDGVAGLTRALDAAFEGACSAADPPDLAAAAVRRFITLVSASKATACATQQMPTHSALKSAAAPHSSSSIATPLNSTPARKVTAPAVIPSSLSSSKVESPYVLKAAARKSARPKGESAAPTSSTTTPQSPVPPPAALSTAQSSSSSSSIIIYCVYSGTTSQRAKAVKVDRRSPNFDGLMKTLQAKFKSDLVLGFIEEDGSFDEVLSEAHLLDILAKHSSADSLTLHCWTKASQHAMDLLYNKDDCDRSAMMTPHSQKSASVISGNSARKSVPGGSSKRKATRPTSARSRASTRSRASRAPLDVSDAYYTEEQLRELFEELDVTGDGFLDKTELRALFRRKYDDMGVADAEKKFESFLKGCNALDDEVVTFDEFCIIMLKLAQW